MTIKFPLSEDSPNAFATERTDPAATLNPFQNQVIPASPVPTEFSGVVPAEPIQYPTRGIEGVVDMDVVDHPTTPSTDNPFK